MRTHILTDKHKYNRKTRSHTHTHVWRLGFAATVKIVSFNACMQTHTHIHKNPHTHLQ